jgi:hypothetical protein
MTTKQRTQMNAAAERREAKRVAHEAMMAAHAKRRDAITLWERAWDLWTAADCKGPEPIHPDNVGQRSASRLGDLDLVNAAAELGIDIG